MKTDRPCTLRVRSRQNQPSIARANTGANSAVRPSVSLVIPVRNEARNIGSVLEQIAEDVDEIILVDGNSTDVTVITAQDTGPTSGS